MFSDESTLQQFVIHKMIIRRLPGNGFYWKNANQITKHLPSHMIWLAIFKSESAPLYFLSPGTAWIIQGFWNYLKTNGNTICRVISAQYVCMKLLYATGQLLFRIFWRGSIWQHWTDHGIEQFWTQLKVHGTFSKTKLQKQNLQHENHWEWLWIKSAWMWSRLITLTNWFTTWITGIIIKTKSSCIYRWFIWFEKVIEHCE